MYINGYALALFSLAQQEKKLIKTKEQSLLVIEALEENLEYVSMLNSKSFDADTKHELITKGFSKKVSKNILNFLLIISDRSKMNLAIPVLRKLVKLINQQEGIQEGVVYSTTNLTPAELTKITNKTSKMLGKKVTLVNKLDVKLISGIQIVVQDEVIEDSVNSRYEQLRNELLQRKEN